MTIFWQDWQQISPSVWTSIYIALLAILFGIPIGCLIAWIRVKRPPILNQLVGIYLSFARSVPMIVVLDILYFALPNLTTVLNGGKGLHIPATVVAVAALALFSSAYFGETFRAAYQALDPAQLEAALASGLSKRTAMKRIVLPQAAALALPNVFNSVMDIVKGTAIIYNIGLLEITGTSILVGSKTYQFIPAYLAAWTIYLVLYWLVSAIFHLIKRQVTYLH